MSPRFDRLCLSTRSATGCAESTHMRTITYTHCQTTQSQQVASRCDASRDKLRLPDDSTGARFSRAAPRPPSPPPHRRLRDTDTPSTARSRDAGPPSWPSPAPASARKRQPTPNRRSLRYTVARCTPNSLATSFTSSVELIEQITPLPARVELRDPFERPVRCARPTSTSRS